MATIKKAQGGKKIKLREDGRDYITKIRTGDKGDISSMKVKRTLKGLLTGAPRVKKAEAASNYKKGGKIAKKGGSFPDLNKDGEITKADVLIGRGVLPKKAQTGTTTMNFRPSQFKRLGRLKAKNPAKAERVGSKMVERATRESRGKEYLKKNAASMMPQMRKGGKMKNCRGGCY